MLLGEGSKGPQNACFLQLERQFQRYKLQILDDGPVIGGTLFGPKACHKISWVSTDRRRPSNQIDHFVISSRFKSCLLDVRNMRDADIDLERDHRVGPYFSCARSASCKMPNINIDRLYNSVVARQWEGYLADRTAYILNNPSGNIDEHWATIKNALSSDAVQVVDHAPKGASQNSAGYGIVEADR